MFQTFNLYSFINFQIIDRIFKIYIFITYLIVDIILYINYYIYLGRMDFLLLLFGILGYFMLLYLFLAGHKIKTFFGLIILVLLLANFWHNNLYGIFGWFSNPAPSYTHNLIAIVIFSRDSSLIDIQTTSWADLFTPVLNTNTDYLNQNAIAKAIWSDRTQTFNPCAPTNFEAMKQVGHMTQRIINPDFHFPIPSDNKIFDSLPNVIIYDAPSKEYQVFEKPWDKEVPGGKFSLKNCDFDTISQRTFYVYQKVSPKGIHENEFMVFSKGQYTRVFASKKYY